MYPPQTTSANQQPPSGPTPTLNELLKSSNTNSNNSNSIVNSNSSGGGVGGGGVGGGGVVGANAVGGPNINNNNISNSGPPPNASAYRGGGYLPNSYDPQQQQHQPNYGPPPIPQQHGGGPLPPGHPQHHIKADYPPGPGGLPPPPTSASNANSNSSSGSTPGINANNNNNSNSNSTNSAPPPTNYRGYPPNAYDPQQQQPNYGPPIPQHHPHGPPPPPQQQPHHHIKSDYPPPPLPGGGPPSASSWPPPQHPQQQQPGGRPPPQVNSYGHPGQPPPQHHQQQPPPGAMYRQGGPGGPRPGPPMPPQGGYYAGPPPPQQQQQPTYPPGPPHSPHYPPPPQPASSSHPSLHSSAQQRYPQQQQQPSGPPGGGRPGSEVINHSPSPQQQQHYSLPPSSVSPYQDGQQQQSSINSSSSSNSTTTCTSTAASAAAAAAAAAASSSINASLNAGGAPDNVPSISLPPTSNSNNSSNSSSSSSSSGNVAGGGGGSSSHHRPKSTPPPPQSPSLQQQQHSLLPNHHHQPPSPRNSSSATSGAPPGVVNSSSINSNSLQQQHRGGGPPLPQHYPGQQQPPDIGDCNSNDSGGGGDRGGGSSGGGMRSSPTGSGSSRSMSPAVGNNPNIPVQPPRPSSQSDGSGGQRQSPMPPGGQYPPQQPMPPPPHHMYPTGGKLSHHPGQMIPPGGPPQGQGHYPPPPMSPHQQQPHWNQVPQGYPNQGRPGQHPQHGGMMPTGYPTPPQSANQPGMPPMNYGPMPPQQPSRHGQPPQSQYGNYPPPQYGGPVPHWAMPPQPNPAQHPPAPPNSNIRSQTPQPYPHNVKQHLQQKLTGFSSPPHQGSYPMGPPSSTPPPPQYGGQGHLPPPIPHPPSHNSVEGMDTSSSNLIGPDGTPLDDASQHSTASGASGGDDGPPLPKMKRDHPNYSSHPPTPQAAPSPGAASLNSMHDEYGDVNSPGGGWPRTPASPVLNSHPPSSSDHFRSKVKKPDSMTKLFEMDNNPERRMFLDKLLHYMDEHGTPITSCPTISKNPLDLFKLYFSVKDRGGFLEVTKAKAWKDVALILGIGASSSAAYTLRKHYTKHLLPFECKFDRGGIDPKPLISQVESTTKKKGGGSKAAPVPSPGSSNSQDSFQGGQSSVPNNNSNSNSASMDGFPQQIHPYGQSGGGGGGGPPSQHPPPVSTPSDYPPNVPPINTSGPSPRTPPVGGSNQPPSQHPGYQGPPPGSYPPYSVPPGSDQYSRGPPPGHHEYQPPPQSYGGSQAPGGYPVPPQQQPSRSMYPYGPESGGGGPPGQGQAPPNASHQQQLPPTSQGPSNVVTGDETHQRYGMGPPSQSPNIPPQTNYPGRPPFQAQGPPPPNGYPSQDYYSADQFSSTATLFKPSRQFISSAQPPELSTLKSTLQGYLQMPPQPGHPPGGGKHMPPPHPGQRRMDYPTHPQQMPPHGKEPPTPQGYPGYPPPPQGGHPSSQQQRMPHYDGPSQGQAGSRGTGFMYPPVSGSGARGESQTTVGNTPASIRSSPSPSPTTNTSAKPWIPPSEGWPSNAAPYQQQPQRPYGAVGGPPPGHPQHQPGSTTPLPPSQSPVPPTSSPQQWNQRVGPPSQGPPTWPHSNSGVSSPQQPPHGQPPWQAQGHHPRNSTRPPFPSMKPEMYKGYPPGSMMSSSAGPPKPNSMLSSQLSPINQIQMSTSMGLPNSVMSSVPQPTPFSHVVPCVPPPMPIKKEIVFPPDSVEAVLPVLTRRKKLHKNDVAPVEPWRIMMCLKSGLLAETTWALDVLNVLLYDDHSISYFSLTYLPGLLDLILEHFRRSLVLVFGQSVGLDVITDKEENVKKNKRKWHETAGRGNDDNQDEVDIGTPLMKYPRNGLRTVVLNGPNYTLKSRITQKEVGILSKDDEPFIVPGARDWDIDEKLRAEPNIILFNTNTMDVTRHVISNFTSDLNIVPIVNVLKKKEPPPTTKSDVEKVIIKSEPTENIVEQSCPPAAVLVNLDLYNCEVRYANDVPAKTPGRKTSHNRKTNSNSSTTATSNDDSSSVQNNWLLDGKNSLFKTGGDKKINCENSGPNMFKGKIARNKSKKLDSIVSRIKNKDSIKQEPNEEDEAMKDMLSSVPTASEVAAAAAVTTKSEEVIANSCSDNAVMMDQATGKLEENSNHSNNITEDNSSSEATCDNSTKSNPLTINYNHNGNGNEDVSSSKDDEPKKPEQLKSTIESVDGELSSISTTSTTSTTASGVRIRSYGSCAKRRRLDEYEDECYTRDEASLYNVTESQDAIARRTVVIGTILMNLTFVPGNEAEIGKNTQFLSLLGKLILLHHDHPLKASKSTSTSETTQQKSRLNSTSNNTDLMMIKDEAAALTPTAADPVITPPSEDVCLTDGTDDDDDLFNLPDGSLSTAAATVTTAQLTPDVDSESCTSLNNEDEWWWEYIHHIRESVLVIIANISGQVDLSLYSEEISRPIIDGLLHWSICPAAYGQDPFPCNVSSVLTPQRLAIEALCKLCVTQGNVDLLLATPPYSRIEKLCQLVSRWLCRSEDQVLREFALNILYYLSGADSGIARTIAQQNPCISLLLSFIEQAESNAANIATNHGFAVLRENPEAMGTSLDMLRRAANTLLNLAKHPDNRALFVQHEPRLLSLVMSQILEQKVAAIVAQVLYQCSTTDTLYCGVNSSAINDSFYTPSLSRSRNVNHHHHHNNPHHSQQQQQLPQAPPNHSSTAVIAAAAATATVSS